MEQFSLKMIKYQIFDGFSKTMHLKDQRSKDVTLAK